MTIGEAETGVPLPKRTGPLGGYASQFRRMAIGQSVLIRGRETTDGLHGYWKHIRDPFGWKMKFSARKVEGGVRVWRVR